MIVMKCKTNEKNPNSLKFTNDVFWVGISQIIIYIISFFTFPVIAKTFGPESYGIWSQIMVTVGLLTPVLTLHLGTAMVRYLSVESSKRELSQSFSNMFFLILFFVLGLILISFIFKNNLSTLLFGNPEFSYYIILTFIWAGSSAFLLYFISFLRAKGKIKELSMINSSCYFIKFIPLLLFAFLGFSLWFIIITQIVIEIFFVCFLTINTIKKIGFNTPSLKNLKKYLVFSIPQIPSGALLWIIDSSDRYFITNILDLTQTGIYSASYTLGTTISLFYVPLSFVVFPFISKFWENNNLEEVKRYLEYSTKLFLILAIPGAVGLYVISKPLLVLLSSTDFISGGGALTFLIALSTIFLGIYQINLYVICLIEKTNVMPIIVFMGALINITLNLILIPTVGIMGAAIATIVSYSMLALIVVTWAKKEVGYIIDPVFLSKIILASTLTYVLIRLFPINSFIDIIFIVIAGSLLYLTCLVLLRTFSNEEKTFIVVLFNSLKSNIKRLVH